MPPINAPNISVNKNKLPRSIYLTTRPANININPDAATSNDNSQPICKYFCTGIILTTAYNARTPPINTANSNTNNASQPNLIWLARSPANINTNPETPINIAISLALSKAPGVKYEAAMNIPIVPAINNVSSRVNNNTSTIPTYFVTNPPSIKARADIPIIKHTSSADAIIALESNASQSLNAKPIAAKNTPSSTANNNDAKKSSGLTNLEPTNIINADAATINIASFAPSNACSKPLLNNLNIPVIANKNIDNDVVNNNKLPKST